MNKLNVIWKPTERCNLACSYCYVGEPAKEVMPAERTNAGILKFAEYIGKDGLLDITFHGGEPTILGLEYYKNVIPHIDSLRSEGYNIHVNMQSNGTLLTTEALEYLVIQHNVGIGLSLDGTELTNGKTRTFPSGKNSYERIVETISKLKEIKKNVGVITVVSRANIDNLVEMYEHLKSIGITGISFNPLFSSGRAEYNSHLHITGEEWNSSMIKFFDYWWNDRERLDEVRPFKDIVKAVLTGKNTICSASKSCQNDFIGVSPNGDAYPCGRFHEDQFRYGNIFVNSIEEIMESPLRKALVARADSLTEGCNTCNFLEVCNGGCMHNAYKMTGDWKNKDPFCEKPLFEVIYKKLEDKLKQELEIIRERKNE